MKKDVLQLVRRFAERETFKFDAFQTEWTRLKFYSYHAIGRDGVIRTRQLEVLLNVVTELVTDTNSTLVQRVGGVYTWYSLYYTQPSTTVKIRLSIEDWKVVEGLHADFRAAGHRDADFILCNLKSFAAFYVCVSRKKLCIGHTDLSPEQLLKAKEMKRTSSGGTLMKKIQDCQESLTHYQTLKESLSDHLPPQLLLGASLLDSIATREDSPEDSDDGDDDEEPHSYFSRRQFLLQKAYTMAPRPVDKQRV